MKFSIIFVILIAISAIMIEDSTERYPLWFSIFFNTLMTLSIFTVICAKNIGAAYRTFFKYKVLSLRMMFSTLLIYTLCFFSTELIGASNYNSFYFAGSALLGSLFIKAHGRQRRINILISIAITVLSVSYGVFLCLSSPERLNSVALGITWAVIGSISGYLYAADSVKLSKKASLSANQILALRFDLLALFSLFMLPADTIKFITVESMAYMFVLALAGTALPIYFLQKGIHAVGAECNAIVVAFIPFATMVFSVAIYRRVIFNEAVFVLLLTALLIIPLYYKNNGSDFKATVNGDK